ncbi:hypothetical protein JMUB6875_37310 [Nocardia sp. JMUB6875]|uniref:serine/threonine-protein kinase n=1 Tax=Nocardia sp. JMUB6875 TaxID=3158170 RepID=UPI0032E71469
MPQALHIVTQAAAGLDHAHRQGLLHRDIKPANILLAPGDPGEGERVLVSDFGIARSVDQSTGLTSSGSILATIAYAPPETFTDATVGPRGDLYSLGVTLFEMLTGALPYPRANPAAVMHAHLYDPVPKPTDLRAGLPDAFDAVIARALAKDPDHRFGTARDLAAAAMAALQPARSAPGPTAAAPRSNPPPPPGVPGPTVTARPAAVPSDRARGRRLVGWAVAVVVAAGIVLGYNVLRTHHSELPPCPTTEAQSTPTGYPGQPTAPPLGVAAATTAPVAGVNCRVAS